MKSIKDQVLVYYSVLNSIQLTMDEESDMREWSLDEEILLFDLMCDFKPAGHNKDKQMNTIVERMNKSISEGTRAFSAEDIWTKLGGMYDLERVDELEDYIDEDEDTGEENDIQSDKEEDNKEDINATNKDSDSSGLSDVETDLPSDKEELEVPKSGSRGNNKNKKERGRKVDLKEESTDVETKDSEVKNEDANDGGENNEDGDEEHDDNDEDDEDEDEQDDENDENEGGEGSLPKRVTRGARKHQHELTEQTGTPKSKKRTRSSAKLDAVETPPPSKRGQKASTPPAQQTPTASAKRRKKSEVQESETDKSNTRRSTRSSVPATTPLKPQAPPIRRSSRKK